MILVYVDEGAGPRSVRFLIKALKEEGLSPKRVNRNVIIHEEWEKSATHLIFPGGRDIPYDRALKGVGNQKIRSFVKNGGKYLGICAGGYYGCNSIQFEKGYPLEVTEKRELSFFPGIARGSVYNPGKFEYESEEGSFAAPLTWNDEKIEIYFNGGCSFIGAESDPNTTILARYADVEDTPAAIINCRVGKGEATLCGVHPEYSARYLSNRNLPIVTQIEKSEDNRKKLFNALLKK